MGTHVVHITLRFAPGIGVCRRSKCGDSYGGFRLSRVSTGWKLQKFFPVRQIRGEYRTIYPSQLPRIERAIVYKLSYYKNATVFCKRVRLPSNVIKIRFRYSDVFFNMSGYMYRAYFVMPIRL